MKNYSSDGEIRQVRKSKTLPNMAVEKQVKVENGKFYFPSLLRSNVTSPTEALNDNTAKEITRLI